MLMVGVTSLDRPEMRPLIMPPALPRTENLDAASSSYEGLRSISRERRVEIPETSTRAQVCGFLILAGNEAHLDPVRHARDLLRRCLEDSRLAVGARR